MKPLLFFFMACLLATPCRAEYNGHHIEFVMETNSGEKLHGYTYVVDQSGLEEGYKTYLENHPSMLLGQGMDQGAPEYVWYSDRLAYTYRQGGRESGDETTLYKLVGERKIAVGQIRKIEILEMIDSSYLIGISSPLTLEDSAWIHTDPVAYHATGGHFCDYTILVHELSEKAEAIFLELNAFDKAFREKIESLEQEMNYTDGNERAVLEAEMMRLEETVDEEQFKVVEKLDRLKVVVVRFCSC